MTDDGVPSEPGQPIDPDIWSDEPASAGPAAPPRRGPRRPPGPRSSSDWSTPRRRTDDEDEYEYVDLPGETRIPRALVGVGAILVVLALLAGSAWRWYQHQVDPPGAPGAEVTVVVPEGASASKVASLLDDAGVITSATIFGYWVGGKDLDTIQAGTYQFQMDSSFAEAVEVLNGGPDQPLGVETTRVSVPEGLTVDETLARIAQQVPRLTVEDLRSALDEGRVPTALQPAGVSSYEGLLFPATYEITEDDDAADVLTMMAQEMESRTQALGIEQAAQSVSEATGTPIEPYDLLVMASLIQEEAGNPDEAPKIGTVMVNRLREGWPLGIDATSRYLAEREGTEIDFASDSPYNTRKNPGLPPTPIAGPGEYALDGAFNPAEGPWMYYVLTEPGVHTFAVTDAEFAAAKQICIEKDLGCG